ncbi:putative transcription factor WRKY family [Helianthus annuus]|uniref:Putative WRKY family transcription factor family protein n=1 Tax=Helianthus annuus TaxID=4232 RepID=A0A251V8G3_HELAN|nr:probable WRKY transcription factor 20 [Helianthus annuus]KAF5815044.1 putative transcription factor WRKY family [Helianthus annuus]KAJ0601519.1 putative transcription factor WRKY family [Helianthus annuus]KAJ0768668.1 putative transcription factor WRKY family [Helianthus annuus]KAJ0774413.1 putative transcription factor WRKY family [Helianthus annuus]KAJ0944299.1 putative transcription factor WRKY family [Helianthus annuus]
MDDLHSPHSHSTTASNADTSGDQSHGGDSSGVRSTGGAKYKLMSPAKLPISRSAYVTVPPGLSPTSFLESPVLLTNIKAEPSPTTGSFFKSPMMQRSIATSAFSLEGNSSTRKTLDDSNSGFFEFRPHTHTTPVQQFSSAGFQVSAGSNFQRGEPSGQYHNQNQNHNQNQSEPRSYASPSTTNWEMASPKEQNHTYMPHEEANGPGKPKEHGPTIQVDRSSDDGYNWRKYGQKVVKGSEHPRSYYKCTHPNCDVKKIFERSYTTGQITEIVYKGTHDHPKPQPSRRFSAGALMSIQDENPDKLQYQTYQAGSANNGQNPNLEASGTPLQSPRQANQDGMDEVDEDDDDPYSKKRRTDFGTLDITPVVKPIREPRVVVQTTSEVDILDDGYRWRKYGQKVVRGNPNPRSYYKCTSVGCTVRKHVERASHDPKAVITAYEGKHNHDVPVAKNNNHDLTGSGNQRTRLEENDALCLDLVVGSRLPEQPQVHVSNSNFRKVVHWNDVYGSRENEVEGCNNDHTTLTHSSNPYPQNIGRIVMGP